MIDWSNVKRNAERKNRREESSINAKRFCNEKKYPKETWGVFLQMVRVFGQVEGSKDRWVMIS